MTATIYNWYKIFNKTEFEALDVPSKSYLIELESLGTKTIVVTKSFLFSILFDDVFIQVQFNNNNPYVFVEGGYASYIDELNDVYFGIEVTP